MTLFVIKTRASIHCKTYTCIIESIRIHDYYEEPKLVVVYGLGKRQIAHRNNLRGVYTMFISRWRYTWMLLSTRCVLFQPTKRLFTFTLANWPMAIAFLHIDASIVSFYAFVLSIFPYPFLFSCFFFIRNQCVLFSRSSRCFCIFTDFFFFTTPRRMKALPPPICKLSESGFMHARDWLMSQSIYSSLEPLYTRNHDDSRKLFHSFRKSYTLTFIRRSMKLRANDISTVICVKCQLLRGSSQWNDEAYQLLLFPVVQQY